MTNTAYCKFKRIAVTQRVDRVDSRDETRDALDRRVVTWLSSLGALPYAVPNNLYSQDLLLCWLEALSPDAIVLSGGNNIGDCIDRDMTEKFLLDYASNLGLPLLGICRGMQMMVHHVGCKLVPIAGHAGTQHELVHSEELTFPFNVNSFHDWTTFSCPDDYEVIATAPDGCVEAVRHRRHSWEGWMWHPERDVEFDSTMLDRARKLFSVDVFS